MNRLKSIIIVLSATFFCPGCINPEVIVVSRDEMEGIDWYYSEAFPSKVLENNIRAYIGKQGSHVWLRLAMTYVGHNWLFVKSVLFKIDSETYELKYGFLDNWEGDNYGSWVWEWKDVVVDKKMWSIINKIANSQRALMRYSGDQYKFEREISNEEKLALKAVISKYLEVGGKPPED
jgi:hypothetical protein